MRTPTKWTPKGSGTLPMGPTGLPEKVLQKQKFKISLSSWVSNTWISGLLYFSWLFIFMSAAYLPFSLLFVYNILNCLITILSCLFTFTSAIYLLYFSCLFIFMSATHSPLKEAFFKVSTYVTTCSATWGRDFNLTSEANNRKSAILLIFIVKHNIT